MSDSFRMTDPAMLRAFAHPVRQRLLFELSARDYARAADLAAATGIPANSVSFHLRTLAKAGLIEEDAEHARDGRDRVWRMVHDSYSFNADEPALTGFMETTLDWIRRFVASHDTSEAGGAMIGSGLLTKDEVKSLVAEIHDTIDRYQKAGAAAEHANPGDPGRRLRNIVFLAGDRDVGTR